MTHKDAFDPDRIDIAKAVRLLRLELGEISQHALAQKLDVQTAMISHWETRVRGISHKNLWKMARLAQVPLCWVFLKEAGVTQGDLAAILEKQLKADEQAARSDERRKEIQSTRRVLAVRSARGSDN